MASRLSYANIISSLALFIALGGGAYAAVTLPARSVGTKQLKPRAVGAAQLKSGAVRSNAVKDGSLLKRDFAPGVLLQGERGLTGEPGAPGTSGTPGAKGDPGPTAASAASRSTCCPDVGVADVTMVDLDSNNDEAGVQHLVLPFRALVLAQATVHLRTSAATAAQARCFLESRGASEADNQYVRMSLPAYVSFPAVASWHLSTGLTGSRILEPGTHMVRAACNRNGGGTIQGLGGNLNVMATPTS